MLGTLEKLSPQDIAALGVVAVALVVCLVCFPCYLAFVAATGCGPPRVQSVCSYILRLVKRRSKFNYHKIDQYIYLGSLPRTMEDLEELKSKGVGAMVTLNEAWEMELSNRFVRDDCGLEHLHLPTPDFFAPKQEDIQAAVRFITAFVDKGIGVYVHCNGGKGRSAVCVICFLASFKDMTPELAYDHVMSRRRVAPMRGSLGLHKQWRAVKRFCRSFGKRRREAREAFTNSPSNVVAMPRPPAPPAPRDDERHVVRNVEQSDAQDANCSEVTAKPEDLAKMVAPQTEPPRPELPQKLPSDGETMEGQDPQSPETHVAITAPELQLPQLVHDDPGDGDAHYDDEENPPGDSDSEEEPPLLE